MRKVKLIFGVALAMLVSVGVYSAFASSVNVSWNFDDGDLPDWTAIYSNADMTIESESNGNKYLKISYNGKANRSREYYDVKVMDLSAKSGIIQADYDIMYTNNDTEKDGEIQFKLRTGPGKTQSTFVARVGKNMTYFRASDSVVIKDINDKRIDFEVGHWYSIKLVVDLDNKLQSVLIFDSGTGELLAYQEHMDTIDTNNKINMITFSSGTDMCIDNLRIYNSSCESGYIYGNPYVSSATKNKYIFIGKTSDGRYTALPAGENTWTLETERKGVSIDTSTARIIVDSKPEPGPVVITAERQNDEKTIKEKKIVNVSK